MTPESRKTALLSQAVGDELVVYDTQSHEAHRLSATAALVWQLADGTRDLATLAAELRRSAPGRVETVTADEVDQAVGEELVRLALKELDRTGLLARSLPNLGEPLSRREWMGVTAALVPVITSIVAPTPAMAQTTIPGLPDPSLTAFNGTYTGNAITEPPNGCGIAQNFAVSVNVTIITATSVIFSIRHTASNTTFSFPLGDLQQTGPNSIHIHGFGNAAPSAFTSESDLDIVRTGPTGPFTMTGHQDVIVPGSCESTANITASK